MLFGTRNWSVASITRRKRNYLTACGVILLGVALQFWDEKNATHSHNMTECGNLTVPTTNDMDSWYAWADGHSRQYSWRTTCEDAAYEQEEEEETREDGVM